MKGMLIRAHIHSKLYALFDNASKFLSCRFQQISLVLLNIKLTHFGNKSIVNHMITIVLRGAAVVKEWRWVLVFESLVTLISSQIR